MSQILVILINFNTCCIVEVEANEDDIGSTTEDEEQYKEVDALQELQIMYRNNTKNSLTGAQQHDDWLIRILRVNIPFNLLRDRRFYVEYLYLEEKLRDWIEELQQENITGCNKIARVFYFNETGSLNMLL
jgi:hypothetical protein